MRVAYLDCLSGISGDMTLASLVDAGIELETLQRGIDSLGLPSCRLVTETVKRKGFRALHLRVEHEPEHAHRHLHHIVKMIDGSILTPSQQELAKKIFTRLGQAEAAVHGTTIEKVHFHEVGAVDSIADIVGAAIGWDLLNVDRIVASPIPTGSGTVQIAHGRCSVPAPATAELLRGVPLAPSDIEAELTTPTGAAIVATLVEEFGPLPAMKIEQIGTGAGTRELEQQANVLRLYQGEIVGSASCSDQVWVVETNLDDVSGELIGHCTARLWEAGALDVYTTAIQMKKNRPGVTLTVLCDLSGLDLIEAILFSETSTLGLRRWKADRHKLQRQSHTVQTNWGPVEGKLAWLAGNAPRFSPEYESCRAVAQRENVPLRDVYESARGAFDPDTAKIQQPDA